MRVLHLFSNHKVTGPAELALDTARALERPQGGNGAEPVECPFIPGRHRTDPPWLADLARQRGARLVQPPGLHLGKHFNPWRWCLDARALAAYLKAEPADLLHCHMPNDHLTAALALRFSGRKRPGAAGQARRPPLVRTLYSGDPEPADWRARRTLGGACDRIICFSGAVEESLRSGPLRIPEERIARLDPPIDTERFSPERRAGLPDFRREQGIPPQALVVGIVARMQRHRRFEVFLDAMRLVADKLPEFRFIIIGRGTHQEAVAREPARRLGLDRQALFAGYLTGDAYVAALLAFDLKVFLVPGSDGTCRAVREALSAGVPVLAARRGMLPEIVRHGISGEVVDDSAENLARAILRLAADAGERGRMSRGARRDAVERFGYERYSERLHAIYRTLLQH